MKNLCGEYGFRRGELYHLCNCLLSPEARKESDESDPRTSLYFTTRVSGIVDVAEPDVAVTVKV